MLRGMAEGFSDSAAQLRAVLHRPQREQRRDRRIDADILLLPGRVGQIAQAGLIVRYESDSAQAPILAEAFVVAEEEELVGANGSSERAAELVALKLGNGALVEVVARIECAVADEFKCGAVQFVGARSRDDADLRAIALAVGGAIGVGRNVELAHSIDAEQLAAGSTGRYVDQRRTGVFDAI